ncbi:MAG TPA: DUF6569 family protein [Terracidiphilus sp.]|jgi:hypothetical protein|nr:DUF6569 family protein [Terracidiphilus sp.]
MPTSFTRAIASLRVTRACLLFSLAALLLSACAHAGGPVESTGYKVLPPIVRGNLAFFPVVAGHANDTSQLLTLDEGIRGGQVTVTEAGDERGLVRPGQYVAPRRGAQVNNLVLTNNSSRPLLLLAGEIVTGGKQDRVIGADRIVPPDSGPIDLGVFCVEPGRWVASSMNFGSMGAQMAQPSVRTPAMAERNQVQVWDSVRAANSKIATNLPQAGPPDLGGSLVAHPAAIPSTTSYAKVFQSAPVEKAVSQYGGMAGEHEILRELRERGAVGVVVAINGQVVWADAFASTDLLARYWPKLMHSYVAEAITSGNQGGSADLRAAEEFISNLEGGREVVETEPGIFRRADVTGDGYRVFELTSLVSKPPFLVHLAKMPQ